MTGDPYDRAKAPAAPAAPVTLSPLRPLRRAVWWWLSTPMVSEGHIAADVVGWALIFVASWAAGGGANMLATAEASLPAFMSGVYTSMLVSALYVVPRLWLRSALHLDDADAREVWERRLTR